MKFTKKSIEQLSLASSDKASYRIFRDSTVFGFCIRVTKQGGKTFIIDKKVNGKLYRFNIGKFGVLTVEQARTEAQKLLAKLVTGNNPLKERQAARQKGITLRQAYEDYIVARKSLKPKTLHNYHLMMNAEFSDWLNKPLLSIKKDMIVKRHKDIGDRSQAGANNALKLLSAIFNFAIIKYENDEGYNEIKENPITRLSQIKAWYPKRRRRTKIQLYDLPIWFQTVNSLRNLNAQSVAASVKHYLILLLFTGLRREEALPLIWSDYKSKNKKQAEKEAVLDLKAKTVFVPDPKNRQDHLLPLPEFICDLFTQWKNESTSKYVFPNADGTSYFKDPKRNVQYITKASGVGFTLHDLRRTFISIAESLDIPAYALKRMLNHKIINSDVTAGYIVSDIDRLKAPMQKVADYILDVVSKQVNE